MKTPVKILASAAVLAFFLLIGWATSYERDDVFDFIDISFHNDSDSCTVTDISLTYRLRRDNYDTLYLPGYVLAPGDTILETWERWGFKQLQFTCNCPHDTSEYIDDLALDTLNYQQLHFDCD